MFDSTKQFRDALEAKELKFQYEYLEDRDKDLVEIRYSGDNMSTIAVKFFFNNDCEDVAVRVFDVVANISDEQVPKMLVAVNEANRQYRFVKFCFDTNDNSIQMEMDAIFRTHDIGEICLEILSRCVNICDDAYPAFMKAMWA